MSQISTRLIKNLAVTNAKLNADVAGNGLQGAAGAPLSIKLDGATLSVSASGIKISTGGVSNNEVNASANIDASKLGTGIVSNTEFNYLDGVTSALQTQLDNKASITLNNLSASTAVNNDIKPATNNSKNLGSNTLAFSNSWTYNSKSPAVAGATYSAGSSSLAGASSGLVTLRSGAGASDQNSGPLIARSGDAIVGSTSRISGDVSFGSGIGSDGSGSVVLSSGTSTAGSSGSLSMYTDESLTDSGAVLISSGNSSAGASGGIDITVGTAATTRGNLSLSGNSISLNPDSSVNMNSKKITSLQDPSSNQDAATKKYVDDEDALKVSKSGDSMSGNLVMQNQKEIRFSELTANGTNYAAIKAPASLAADYTLTLPVDDGTPGQALTTDGSGVLSWSTSSGGDVSGPASSVDSQVALFNGTTGKLLKAATSSGVAHLSSGVLSASNVILTSEVSGILPIANGGTNSSSALSNNRVMQSSGGAIVEAAAITAARALISDANGIPTHSSVTSTELGYVSGVTSAIQTQINNLSSSIQNFEWQPSVLSATVLDTASLTPVAGDRYLVNGSGLNGFLGHNNEIAQYVSGNKNLPASWSFTSPSTGMFVAADDANDRLFLYGGASWSEKYFESTTASTGLVKVGFDVRLDASSAGDGLAFTTGVLSVKLEASNPSLQIVSDELGIKFDPSGALSKGAAGTKANVDNSTIEISSNALRVKDAGITDAKIATGIDAAKIADGSVSNAEFQFINSLTSNAQTQLNNKASIALDNLASTAVNADIIPGSNATRALGSPTLAWTALYANAIRGGPSADLTIRSQAPAAANSKAVFVQSEDAASTFNSGSMSFRSGVGSGGTASSGSVSLGSGLAAGASGFAKLLSGAGASSGNIEVGSGDASAGTSGSMDLHSGAATGNTGAVALYSGDSSAGNSGSVTLQAGTASGTRGSIILSGLQINASSSKIINVTNPTSAQDAATKAYVDGITYLTAGNGLTKTGSSIDVVSGNSAIVANADDITLTLATSSGLEISSGLKTKFDNTTIKVNGSNQLQGLIPFQEEITLSSGNITAQNFTLAHTPPANSVQLMFEGVVQRPTLDFTVSGAVVSFAGDLATGGAVELIAGDKLYMSYSYL